MSNAINGKRYCKDFKNHVKNCSSKKCNNPLHLHIIGTKKCLNCSDYDPWYEEENEM